MVLNDLLEWFEHSSVTEGDELLTRYSLEGTRKVVIRKDVRPAIKEAVSEMGLPSEHFSTKSLRSGFSTHASANGMSGVEVNNRGRLGGRFKGAGTALHSTDAVFCIF